MNLNVDKNYVPEGVIEPTPCPRSAGKILRAVINDHMTCYNLNWPKIKLFVHYLAFSCASGHILKSWKFIFQHLTRFDIF